MAEAEVLRQPEEVVGLLRGCLECAAVYILQEAHERLVLRTRDGDVEARQVRAHVISDMCVMIYPPTVFPPTVSAAVLGSLLSLSLLFLSPASRAATPARARAPLLRPFVARRRLHDQVVGRAAARAPARLLQERPELAAPREQDVPVRSDLPPLLREREADIREVSVKEHCTEVLSKAVRVRLHVDVKAVFVEVVEIVVVDVLAAEYVHAVMIHHHRLEVALGVAYAWHLFPSQCLKMQAVEVIVVDDLVAAAEYVHAVAHHHRAVPPAGVGRLSLPVHEAPGARAKAVFVEVLSARAAAEHIEGAVVHHARMVVPLWGRAQRRHSVPL
mmetsp:Transcript_15248/g.59628  ORF Transcript_15248/g.59628 Transcript_15248/m.59628 type:complete len:330 (-) Transcript_15248:900-1889(-)